MARWQNFKCSLYLNNFSLLNDWKCEMTHEFLLLNYKKKWQSQPLTESRLYKAHQYFSPLPMLQHILSPSSHLQQWDNFFKDFNRLPCDSKEENFKGKDKEINPLHINKYLVSCDEEIRHQHHTQLSTCFQWTTKKRKPRTAEWACS